MPRCINNPANPPSQPPPHAQELQTGKLRHGTKCCSSGKERSSPTASQKSLFGAIPVPSQPPHPRARLPLDHAAGSSRNFFCCVFELCLNFLCCVFEQPLTHSTPNILLEQNLQHHLTPPASLNDHQNPSENLWDQFNLSQIQDQCSFLLLSYFQSYPRARFASSTPAKAVPWGFPRAFKSRRCCNQSQQRFLCRMRAKKISLF